jgi:hypothetical protein
MLRLKMQSTRECRTLENVIYWSKFTKNKDVSQTFKARTPKEYFIPTLTYMEKHSIPEGQIKVKFGLIAHILLEI